MIDRKRMFRKYSIVGLLAAAMTLSSGCTEQKKDTGDKVSDAIKSAGDKVGDAADTAIDKTEDVARKVKKEVHDATR